MTDPVSVIKSVPFWTSPGTWSTIESGTHALTSFYLLSAVDLRWNADGSIERVPPEQAIFLRVFARTFLVAATVTLATLILGFPLAYLISSVPKTLGAILIVAVLLPFWTSILVRTAAWTVLLQKFGLVNDVLLWLGVTGTRLDLMYSRIGLIIAMTHIQLPFTLLPIYSVMRTIQPSQMRAAYSLGGRPFTSFLPRLSSAGRAGHHGRLPAHLHPLPRLLHHAGADRRRQRPADQQFHRQLRQCRTELGDGCGAQLHPPRFHHGTLCGVFARMLGLDRLKPV